MCRRRPGADDGDAESRQPRNRVEPVARHRAPPVRGSTPARRRPRPGGRPVRRELQVGVKLGNTDSVVYAEPSSPCWRWIAGGGTRPRTQSREPSRSSRSTGCTTSAQRARVRRRRSARPAPRRSRRAGQRADPGHARSAVVHVCLPVPGGPRSCSWPRRTWREATTPTARHLLREIDDVLATDPTSAPWSTRYATSAGLSLRARRRGHRRTAPDPGGLGSALPADAPDHRRDRRAAVRLTEHRQLGGRLDLPEARRLLPQRRRGTGNRGRTPRRVGADPADSCSSASASYPRAIASLGAAATTRASPPPAYGEEDVDHLGRRRAGIHRVVGRSAVRGDLAAHRDQRGESDQSQGPRVELGFEPAGVGQAARMLRPVRLVDGQAM